MKNEKSKEIKNQKAKRGPGRPRKNNKADAPIMGAGIGAIGACADIDKIKSILEDQNTDTDLSKLIDAFNSLKALQDSAEEIKSTNSEDTCACGDNCKCNKEDDMAFDLAAIVCKHCEDAAVFESLLSNPEYLESFWGIIDAIEQAKADFEAEQEEDEDEDPEVIEVETFSETPDSEIYRIVVTVDNPSAETFEKLIELFPDKE